VCVDAAWPVLNKLKANHSCVLKWLGMRVGVNS